MLKIAITAALVVFSAQEVAAQAQQLPTVPEATVGSAMECASRVSALPMVNTIPVAKVSNRWSLRYREGPRIRGKYEPARGPLPPTVFLTPDWTFGLLAHEAAHHLQVEHGIDPLSEESERAARRVERACRPN